MKMSRILLLLGGLMFCGIQSGVDGAGLPVRLPGNLQGRERRVPCQIPPPDAIGNCIMCNGEPQFQLAENCWCDVCNPGRYMNKPCVCAPDGTVTTLTDCVIAENGSMNVSNWCDTPYPCTECKGDLVPTTNCSPVKDTICGPEPVTDKPEVMPITDASDLKEPSTPDKTTTADTKITRKITKGITDFHWDYHTLPGITTTPDEKKDIKVEDSPDDEDGGGGGDTTTSGKCWLDWHHATYIAFIVILIVAVAILFGIVVVLAYLLKNECTRKYVGLQRPTCDCKNGLSLNEQSQGSSSSSSDNLL